MNQYDLIPRRVKKGLTLIIKKGFESKIDIDRLDMAASIHSVEDCGCIAAQISYEPEWWDGRYTSGLTLLNIKKESNKPITYGFIALSNTESNISHEYHKLLTNEWQKQIKKYRETKNINE